MKKPIAVYSILFILVFLFYWYFSEIISVLTPFFLIIFYPVLLFIMAMMLICSIIFFIINYKVFRWKAAVPLIILALMIAMILFFPYEKAKVLTEFILYTHQREKVVDMIENDPSFANVMYGNVSLPAKYRYLSCDGDVYVLKHTANTLVIGFWAYRGLSINGYSMVYYTSTQDESTLLRLIDDDISTIIRLNSHWYYVVID